MPFLTNYSVDFFFPSAFLSVLPTSKAQQFEKGLLNRYLFPCTHSSGNSELVVLFDLKTHHLHSFPEISFKMFIVV